MKYRFRHVIEYLLLRTVAGVVCILPYRAALFLGWLLAGIGFYVVRWRVEKARCRIREVFPDMDPADVHRTAWISMRNMFFNAVEVMRVPRMTDEWIATHIDSAAADAYKARTEDGEGGIFTLPHMGNWDMAGVAASALDIPIFFITGTQRNPLFDDYINTMRSHTGIETIPRDSKALLKKVIRNLKAGKVLAFTNDLRSRTKAMNVRFLGKQANIVSGMALFARQADVPIYPIIVRRIGWSRHAWEMYDTIRPDRTRDKAEDWQRMTQAVMDVFTDAVRTYPEQYFWYNKRWVLDPFTESGASASATPAAPSTPSPGPTVRPE